MVLSMTRRRRANVFSVNGSAPAGATENSQGRKPLVFGETDRQPWKGGRRLLSPFQGSAPLYRRFQGLAPLANNFRRSAALRIASHRFAASLVFKLRTIGLCPPRLAAPRWAQPTLPVVATSTFWAKPAPRDERSCALGAVRNQATKTSTQAPRTTLDR